MPLTVDFVSRVKETLEGENIKTFGWTALTRPLSMDIYLRWLEAGRHGTMKYLYDHASLKENSKAWAPRAVSAIVVTKPYAPTHPYPSGAEKPQALRTALYARGGDYHSFFKEELEGAAHRLKLVFPEHEFLCFTDSAPVLERDLAYRAGLGWIGKNSCLIHPQQGSLFFIGQILTSLPAPDSPAPVTDHCGTCDRCITACPTGALLGDRTLDARRCISYWTIEARTEAPSEIRASMGDWFFGCDICQTVCPWNEKVFGREAMKKETLGASSNHHEGLIDDLRWILNSSGREISRHLRSTPLMRARPAGLKRNALIVIGNLKIQALGGEVQRSLKDPRLKDLAQWVMTQLNLSLNEPGGLYPDSHQHTPR